MGASSYKQHSNQGAPGSARFAKNLVIRALSQPAHQTAQQRQLFIQLFGGVPVVAVKIDPAVRGQFQVRAAAHGVQGGPVKTPEMKLEVPGQKALAAIDDAIGHHETRPLQHHKQVAENTPYFGQPAYLIEGVFKVGVRGVERVKLLQAFGRQALKKINPPRHRHAAGTGPVIGSK